MLDTAAPIARPGARRSRHVAHASSARADAHTTHASRRSSRGSSTRMWHASSRDRRAGVGTSRPTRACACTTAPARAAAVTGVETSHMVPAVPASGPWDTRLPRLPVPVPFRHVPWLIRVVPATARERNRRRHRGRRVFATRFGPFPHPRAPARGGRADGLRAATSLLAKKGLPNQPPGPRPRTDTASAPSASRSSRCSPVYWMPTTRIVPPGFTTRCICPMAVRRSSRSLMLRIATLAVTSPKVWSDIGREVMSAVSTSIRSATPFATASARVRSAGRASRCRPSRSRPGGRASRRNVLREMERGLRQERQPDDKPTDPTAVRRGHRREPGREERDERDGEQGRPGPDVTKAQVGDLGLRV
jgi:hypothetical protein